MYRMNILALLGRRPDRVAVVKGAGSHPCLRGTVGFYQVEGGVLVCAQISGLPQGNGVCDAPVFAMHIHGGTSCTGNETDAFADAMSHYNPKDCLHPYHAGDMPPLFGVDGIAFSAFLTDRFSLPEITGKTVIIHEKPDDFTTQPAGNAGQKIACGVIV